VNDEVHSLAAFTPEINAPVYNEWGTGWPTISVLKEGKSEKYL
jgi:hypothetical protein